jgi:hypothetical protein
MSSYRMTTAMSTVSSTPMETMPSWMSIGEDAPIGADVPVARWTLAKKPRIAGKASKVSYEEAPAETNAMTVSMTKSSLKKKLSNFYSGFKGFFQSQANIRRVV